MQWKERQVQFKAQSQILCYSLWSSLALMKSHVILSWFTGHDSNMLSQVNSFLNTRSKHSDKPIK